MGHPVLLWLVLEYSLAMVDCHHQPCQGVFAGQGLHHQSPVLMSSLDEVLIPKWTLLHQRQAGDMPFHPKNLMHKNEHRQ